MKILVLNAGSSSQKSCLYDLPEGVMPNHPPEPLWEGFVDFGHQEGMAEVKVKTAHGATWKQTLPTSSRAEVTSHLLQTLAQGDTKVLEQLTDINVVGHRIVHGGADYQDSTAITPAVKAAIARLSSLAPAHNPANLSGIESIEVVLGDVPQVAVFDTAFHSHMPRAAAFYAVPYAWVESGIRRYGFHGISHQYCTHRAAQLLDRRVAELRLIICHLGNGASLSAVRNGRSIDTTMGFTPLDGLMMGSRSGAIDPGILIHLLRKGEYDVDQLDRVLNKESGLLGISGVSSDLRQVMAAIDEGNAYAQLALEMYIHRLRSCMGSMLASLGGVDAIVFTAGVGENSPVIRAGACEAFQFLGLMIDREKNEHSPRDAFISTPDSSVHVLIVHTQEDWAIAQECWRLHQ